MPLLPPSRFAELQMEVAAATQPVTGLECWFANEITQATWELECVRANKFQAAAGLRLNDAYSHAARNWNRARNELAKLQTARINHVIRLSPSRQREAAATPLADPARVRVPKLAGAILDNSLHLIEKGIFPLEAIRLVNAQENR